MSPHLVPAQTEADRWQTGVRRFDAIWGLIVMAGKMALVFGGFAALWLAVITLYVMAGGR